MTINNKLRLIVIAFLVMLIVIVGIIVMVMGNTTVLHEKSLLLNKIVEQIALFNSLTYEYFLFHGERTLFQWYRQSDNLKKSLGDLEKLETNTHDYIVNIRIYIGEQEDNFKFVLSHQEIINNKESLSQRINSSILNAQKLSTILFIYFKENSTQKWNIIINGYFVLILATIPLIVIILTITLLMNGSIRKSIQKLLAGVAIIKSGNFTHHIDLKQGDELAELADNFNGMTDHLIRVMTSRDVLEQEVSRRVKAEEEIRLLNAGLEQVVEDRTRELVSANKELEAFSYSVSHDLRAPLRAIDGFSRVLIEKSAGSLDGEAVRHLNIIRKNTQNMGQLIDDLLSFSRIGRQEITSASVDMGQLASELAVQARARNPERTLSIAVKPCPDVLCDLSMIKIVLDNLLSNAVKFTAKKSIAEIEFGGARAGDEAVFYVKDNGAGFNMQYADKLFGVFQRLHRQDEFEGTGIGLALVKRIITRHGGRVWAEGAVNGGAAFYFTLPASG